MGTRAFLSILLGLLCWTTAAADVIRMKDGSEYNGTILEQTETHVIVQFDFGTMTFAPGDIAAVVPGAVLPEPAPTPPEQAPQAKDEPDEKEAATAEEAEPKHIQDAMRGVVSIRAVSESGQQRTASGALINSHGVILTNHHVVAGAKEIQVVLPFRKSASRYKDPKRYDATVSKASPYYDLAVIDIHAKTPDYLTIADSDHIVVGDEVKAIGNPMGLVVSVSQGIVSGVRTNRSLRMKFVKVPSEYMNEREFESITWIQTDASINPGNSGGPLLNADNEIIGINTWIVSASGGSAGLGFALHAKHIRKFAAGHLPRTHRPRRR